MDAILYPEFTLIWLGKALPWGFFFLHFWCAFNPFQPLKLQDKLNSMSVDSCLVAWIFCYLTDGQQYIRLKCIMSDTLISSTGAPKGKVLAPLLFTLYTINFCYNSELCHIQKYTDDKVIIGCIKNDRGEDYRRLLREYGVWYHINYRQINTWKTKELVLDFGKSRPGSRTPISVAVQMASHCAMTLDQV